TGSGIRKAMRHAEVRREFPIRARIWLGLYHRVRIPAVDRQFDKWHRTRASLKRSSPMACSVGNIQDAGHMPGSKSCDVTLSGDDLTFGVAVYAKAFQTVPNPPTQAPKGDPSWSVTSQINQQTGVAHFVIITGCQAGWFIVAVVEKDMAGSQGSAQVGTHPI